MTQRRRTVLSSAFGPSGLAVLFLVLGGFVAMHGFTATTATGVHHNPVLLMSAPERHHPTGEFPEAGDMATTGPSVGSESHIEGSGRPDTVPEATEGGHDGPAGSHGPMAAGCLLALVGMLAAVVLRWCRVPRMAGSCRALSFFGRVMGPPERSPPRRSRISLCVMRV